MLNGRQTSEDYNGPSSLQGIPMKFLIEFEVFESIIGDESVGRVRQLAVPVFEKMLSDPRVISSGHLLSGRKGFWLIEAGSAEEIMQLTGPLLDFMNVRIEPYVGFDVLLDFFRKG
jgi:hypothetical protein